MSDALERLRIQRGLSRTELAERAGISAESIRRVERGITRSVRLRVLLALATALGMKPLDLRDALYAGEGTEQCRTDAGA